jgi:hypothetical protein
LNNRSQCVTDNDLALVSTVGSWEINYLANEPTLLKLGIGPLLEEMWHAIESDDTERSSKFTLLSAHDGTLVYLLNALNVSDGSWPPFASHIVWERYLSNSTGHQALVMKYNGRTMVVPGCDSAFCKLEQFKAAVSRFFWTDGYRKTCAN